MSAWGTPNVGVALPARQSKPGGLLYLLPIGWLCTFPLWLVGLIAASTPYVECEPYNPDGTTNQACQAMKAAAAEDNMRFLVIVFGTVVAVTAIVAAIIGWRHRRKGWAFMCGRTGLVVMTALVSLWHLAAYAIGFGLGRVRKNTPRMATGSEVAPVDYRTEAEWMRDATDTITTVRSVIEGRTGELPGAVLGWTTNGRDAIVTARPRGGVLVLGPPGEGKTSAVIIPSVMLAPGACVSSSIKSDVMNATAPVRAKLGRCWHFDPGGDEVTPPGVSAARWSPLVGVRTWDDALQVGASMAAAHALTTGHKNSGAEHDHFIGRATDWLQVLLYAAHLSGGQIEDVAEWATAAGSEASQTEVLTILVEAEKTGDAGAGIAGRKLLGLIATPERERGSIISTMVGLLRVYDSVSARELGRDPTFDPRYFVRSRDTLYITARPDRQALYAPLLASLLEAIRLETYDRHKRSEAGAEPRYPHVTFALDEANTTAPIPLPAIISEAGGQGLHIVVGVQALGPAIARWGEAAKSFLTLFPTKVIFRGTFDRDTVQALSNAAGEFDRHMVSYSESVSYAGAYGIPVRDTLPSYSLQRQKRLTEGDITAIPAGQVLVWHGPAWDLLAIGMHWQAGVWLAAVAQARAKLATTSPAAIEAP